LNNKILLIFALAIIFAAYSETKIPNKNDESFNKVYSDLVKFKGKKIKPNWNLVYAKDLKQAPSILGYEPIRNNVILKGKFGGGVLSGDSFLKNKSAEKIKDVQFGYLSPFDDFEISEIRSFIKEGWKSVALVIRDQSGQEYMLDSELWMSINPNKELKKDQQWLYEYHLDRELDLFINRYANQTQKSITETYCGYTNNKTLKDNGTGKVHVNVNEKMNLVIKSFFTPNQVTMKSDSSIMDKDEPLECYSLSVANLSILLKLSYVLPKSVLGNWKIHFEK
jgi:hypothetical protein